MMNILGVSEIYPTADRPNEGTFVQALYDALERCGANVEAIAPYSRTREVVARRRRNGECVAFGPNGRVPARPAYWSLSARLLPWRDLGWRASLNGFRQAVVRGSAAVAG